MSPVIEEHARARLITDGPLTRPVPVDLRYDPADERRTVHIGLPDGTDWAFGRDLLERGLRTPIERGAVRIWPCGRTQLIVELHSTDGVEVFQFEIRTLIRFLARTRTQTPAATPDAGRTPQPPSRTTRTETSRTTRTDTSRPDTSRTTRPDKSAQQEEGATQETGAQPAHG
ncbi:SsgA family sporulation/cell division regulator [Streptomyces globisporus]|uniref:Sporulation-specific cell division protein, SsgA-like n=1 Tax=Streptomyces globisporus TaxID=1908 RepID=A0ABM9H645_STRGL|nr:MULTISPECIES: SsgA family sporulation/cell division regulator [Streptomyces]PPA41797.1 SsgE protein [Streptomyces griseus]RAN19111.1 SsgE protein [Streptomyces badius]AWL87930.1 SsgA family sporulation/cell division regulator [Streptomyces globisporus]RAN27021.1 SsgE protein [Streptomyces badius]RDL01334.1 sporulation and cell division protein SsgA [Streptomyces sp. HB202]